MTALKNKLFKESLNSPLGIWQIEKCNIKLNNKIDLSNEDHCGPCGEYMINKKQTILLQDKK